MSTFNADDFDGVFATVGTVTRDTTISDDSGKEIGTIKKGTKVEVISAYEKTTKITHEGKTGWIPSSAVNW